jgi:Recombinase zinc beta ribbon domain
MSVLAAQSQREVVRSRPRTLAAMTAQWAVSRTLSHPALVSEADFVAVQQRRAARKCEDGTTRDYVLAGLVQCRSCGRRMDSHWVNGRAGYRCRHCHQSARARPSDAARNIYVREDVLLDGSRGNSRPIGTDPAATSS